MNKKPIVDADRSRSMRTDDNKARTDTANTGASTAEDSSMDQSAINRFTRRGIIITASAGAISSFTTSAQAEQRDIGELVIENVEDISGGNTDSIPDRLYISSDTTFRLKMPTWIEDGKEIVIAVKLKRLFGKSERSGTYETIGEGSFRHKGKSEYVLTGDTLPVEGRNLFNHSDVDPTDFRVDKSLSDLEHKQSSDNTNRYTTIDFKLQWSAVTRDGKNITSPAEEEFTAKYALAGGLGVNLGYNLGQKAPTSEFVGKIND